METFIESESTKKEITKFNKAVIDITIEYLEEGGKKDRNVKECSSCKRKFDNEVDYNEPLNKI